MKKKLEMPIYILHSSSHATGRMKKFIDKIIKLYNKHNKVKKKKNFLNFVNS
jgi:hypothetical protein